MDKYEKDVAYLTEHPEEIGTAWRVFSTHAGGALFRPAGLCGMGDSTPDGGVCGCLTTIRSGLGFATSAWTPELTEAIKADVRIPSNKDKITVADLPVFAEWQRRLDRELGRLVPA